jgi:hypothetical protein
MKIRQYTYFILCMSIGFVAGLKWIIRHGIAHLIWTYLFGVANASEAEEASGIVKFIRKRFPVTGKSNAFHDSSMVYCMPGGTGILGRTPHRIMVHAVSQKHQQDHIIDLIRRYRTKNNLRAITIQFIGNGKRIKGIVHGRADSAARERKEFLRSETIK